jgi:hypothetical protein
MGKTDAENEKISRLRAFGSRTKVKRLRNEDLMMSQAAQFSSEKFFVLLLYD